MIHIELPTIIFFIVALTNIMVMFLCTISLYEYLWKKWRYMGAEKIVHIFIFVGMLTSFFVAILSLLKSISGGGDVVRLFG